MVSTVHRISEHCTPYEKFSRTQYLYQLSPTDENYQILQDFHKQYHSSHKPIISAPNPQNRPIRFEESFFFHNEYPIAVLPHLNATPLDWHYHDFFELVYICRGSYEHLLKGTFITMKQGDLCIIPPNQAHAIACNSPDGIALNILIRKSTFRQIFKPLLSDYGLLSAFFSHTLFKKENTAYLLFQCGDDRMIHSMVTAMYEEYIDFNPFSRSILVGQLMQLLGHLMRFHQLDAVQMRGKSNQQKPTQITRLLQYISDHLRTITLQELAQEFSYSSGRCSNIIKEATGKTFTEIVREERANRAAHLLLDTNDTLMKIAEAVGFCDTSHFHRAFSAIYGVTPSQYRKENRSA